ncbi:MAG: phytanoyl-CoA dioxygenase, partial [Actinomycetota bacterium]|nr:phytanoyl-CoA dioxygenase [Actinomycetota bacterium]
YPQVNVKNANDNEYYAYGDYINSLAEQYDCAKYLPHKGELFIWHPLLVHGGSEIIDPARTRKSYVCHYIAENCDQSDSVAGPFRW